MRKDQAFIIVIIVTYVIVLIFTYLAQYDNKMTKQEINHNDYTQRER